MSSTENQPNGERRTPEELMSQVRFLEAEVTDLRRRLSDAPGHSRSVELRLADTQRSLSAVTAQNERLGLGWQEISSEGPYTSLFTVEGQGLAWGKGFTGRGLLPQMHRGEAQIFSNVRRLLEASGRSAAAIRNVPNRYLRPQVPG